MHEVKVIKIDNIRQHENADRLEIIDVKRPGGQDSCIVRKGQFQVGDLAIFVEADYMVPTGHALFSTFKSKPDEENKMLRVKAKRLRGIWSNCLLVKVQDGIVEGQDAMVEGQDAMAEGQDVMRQLGIERYDPDAERDRKASFSADCAKAPDVHVPVYDVEAGKKYDHRLIFEPGEMIAVTEKIHGTNARYMYYNGEMFCGSHRTWKKDDDVNLWWKVLHQNEWLEEFCMAHEGLVVYGEIFGDVQNLKYGAKNGELSFMWFDLFDTKNQRFFTWHEIMKRDEKDPTVHINMNIGIYYVPILNTFNYDPSGYDKETQPFISGDTCAYVGTDDGPPYGIREGIVVRSLENDWSTRSNMRKMLKYVSNEYLEL